MYDATTDLPNPNEAVLFFDADGTLIVEAMTDADGRASSEVEAGGSVVCMLHADNDALPFAPVAYVDVQPGDDLTYRLGLPSGTGTVSVTAPSQAAATQYRLGVACGSRSDFTFGTSPMLVLGFAPCANADVLVSASNAGGFLGVVGASQLDTNTAVNLSGPYITPSAFQIAVTGIQNQTDTVDLEVWHALGRAIVPSGFGGTFTPSANRVQASGQLAAVPNSSGRVLVSQKRSGYMTSTAEIYRPYSADILIDTGAVAMPWIAGPAVDIANHRVVWTREGSGSVDGMVANATFRRGGVTYAWTVGGNPSGTELVLPVLPAPWGDYNPVATDETAGDFAFFRGAGLAERAHLDPVSLYVDVAGAGDVPSVDYAMAFSRTNLP